MPPNDLSETPATSPNVLATGRGLVPKFTPGPQAIPSQGDVTTNLTEVAAASVNDLTEVAA